MAVLDHTLTSFASEELFGYIDSVGAGRIVPLDRAQPGDIIGCVLSVSFIDDKHMGHNIAFPVSEFLVMTEDGPGRLDFAAMEEHRKDAVARLSLEISLCALNGLEDVVEALRAVEDEESGTYADILVMPNLALVREQMLEDRIDLDWGDEDAVAGCLDRHLAAVRRPAVSNHEAIAGRPTEQRDLAAMMTIFPIRENSDDPDRDEIRLHLPRANT